MAVKREAEFHKLFNDACDKGLFNGNVLIAEGGRILYSEIFGVADCKSGRLLTPETVFNVASIAKPFTSAAILLLKEQGKLQLDDTIERWFPHLPYKEVTIRHLLGHTAGIPNYVRPVRMGEFGEHWNMHRLAYNEEMVEQISRLYPSADFAPNEENAYSNTGYLLLALLIEKIADRTFHSFLADFIFTPLNMKRTLENNDVNRADIITDYAIGHLKREDGTCMKPHELPEMEFSYYLDGLQGDGNVHTTMNDLFKWDRALYTDTLLSKSTLSEAFTPVVLNNKRSAPNGLGWFVSNIAGKGRKVEHSGYWPGYQSTFQRYVDLDKTVIILNNIENLGFHEHRTQLLAKVGDILFTT